MFFVFGFRFDFLRTHLNLKKFYFMKSIYLCQGKFQACHLRIKTGHLLTDLKFKSGHSIPLKPPLPAN